MSSRQDTRGVVLHLLEYPKQTDTQIRAIHHQAQKHHTNQRNLVVTNIIPRQPRSASKIRYIGHDTWEGAEPTRRRHRCAAKHGCEEVVEAQGERSGPSADEERLGEGVEQFAGGAPETEWSAEVFQLGGGKFHLRMQKRLDRILGHRDKMKWERT